MEPIPKGEEYGRSGSVYGQNEFAGWVSHSSAVPTSFACGLTPKDACVAASPCWPARPAPAVCLSCARWGAQPKLVPTVIVWAHGGSHVELEGSFDSWTQRHAMQRSGKDFTIVKLLPPGVYQVRGRGRGGRSSQTLNSLHAATCAAAPPSTPVALLSCSHPAQQPGCLALMMPLQRPPPCVPRAQYKFIVDGLWRHDPNLTSMYDDMGNINNVLEVQVGGWVGGDERG